MDTHQLAKLGILAHDFFTSGLGRFVTERAIQQIEEAQAKLLDVNPADIAAVTQLQQAARVPRQAIEWLQRAMMDGELAQQQLAEDSEYE